MTRVDSSEALGRVALRGGVHNQIEVSSSQIPSINLLVNLNDATCRKRKRRQLSNLFLIKEEMARESSSWTCSPSSSSSLGETLQSSSLIVREVRATMAVGAEIGVRYSPAYE